MIRVKKVPTAFFDFVQGVLSDYLPHFWDARAVDHEIAASASLPKLSELFIADEDLRRSRRVGAVLKVVGPSVEEERVAVSVIKDGRECVIRVGFDELTGRGLP